ncbi:Tat pathway signal protein [Roseomonas sp. BN140053]|uniref:Tat pathway signal protein n=1 Tax=Roseomonas sp. BN140053 TaxID=3391898 RepID=UPI0039E7D0C7
MPPLLAGILGLLVALPLAAPAAAQQAPTAPMASPAAPPIGLELNRLEPRPDLSPPGCRAWLLLRNPGEAALDPLRLDLLLFGKDGVIGRRLALDLGPLPGAKTMARIFDLPGLPCDGIGSVLLNDLMACGPTPEGRSACLPRLVTTSRVEGVPFDK